VLTARGLVEDFLGAIEKERALLRRDDLDLEAIRLRNAREGFIRSERSSVHDGVGHDDDGAAVTGEQPAHLAQSIAHFLRPQVARLVEAQAAVATAGPDLLMLEAARLETQPAHAMNVMIEVVVDARVGRRGDDQIDRGRLQAFDVARIGASHRGPGRAVPDARSVRREALAQLSGLLDEEPNGEAAR
jgi:hypothetical protein